MAPVTILLVDDDPLIRTLVKELLERLGYRVEVAEDGAEALKVWRSLGGVDLVIMDYNLPEEDGCQVLGKLRTLDPGVRVLMASGFFSFQDVARLKEEGARGLIYKPYRLAELQSRIQQVLSGLGGF